jgi:hypothetical protein
MWPLVENWIAAALERGKADQTPDDIRQHLQRATIQLWLAWGHEPRPRGCCVTEIAGGARGKVCNLVIVAGLDLASWLPLLAVIEAWAREAGAVRLEASGRAGWERRLKSEGWKPVRTTIELEL